MESRAYQATPTPVLVLLPSLLTTKTNRTRLTCSAGEDFEREWSFATARNRIFNTN